MPKEKSKTEFEELQQTYAQWEEFMSRSKIKMRKKINKDKQEYYDFDYTRGQYYYNYPQHHINFASPERQKSFFQELLQNQTQELSEALIDQHEEPDTLEKDLKPLQMHEFLKQFHFALHGRIAALRIRKTFMIREKPQQKSSIELMEAEIRSLFYRYQKLQNIFFTFSQPLAQRIQGATCSLKIKTFDEFHFSNLEKGDFVVFLRMENVRQRVQYPLDCLLRELKLAVCLKKGQIKGRCYDRRARATHQLQKQHGQQFLLRREKIENHFKQKNIQFLQNEDNLQLIQEYLLSLNFVEMFKRHRSSNGKPYLDGRKLLAQLPYIPGGQSDLRKKLLSISSRYFPEGLIEDLYDNKRQNMCFRLNYFASIMLRTMSETYNFLVQIKEKDIHQLRSMMRRELETMFTSDVDRLFNLAQHQIILLVDEGDYQLEQLAFPSASQQQSIFQEYFRQHNLSEPVSQAILHLLDTFNQKVLIELAEEQAKAVVKNSSNKLKYLSLYYRNLHSDEKSHLISLMNAKLLLGMFHQNIVFSKLDKILEDSQVDFNLLRTTFILNLIRCVQLKKDLEHVLTAQISLMYQLKYKLQLLKYKDSQPFEMSPQFMTRFCQSNNNPQPFDFLKRTEQAVDSDYPDPQLHDKIFRAQVGSQHKVEVRRMMPENPLFQGKKILYREALRESDSLVKKWHQMCAFLIERRENYLNEEGFTGIIDRFQLVRSIIEAEITFQTSKLSYLQEQAYVLNSAIDPTGIWEVGRCMVETKSKDVFLSLNAFHCLQEYEACAQVLARKSRVLKHLRQTQVKIQQEERDIFREKLMKHNHVNNIPQISSVYFYDEPPMDTEVDNIVEADEESSSQFSQSQFYPNSIKNKSELSVASSDYNVKTTFKQILGRSALNSIASDVNKREELMGRKKKQLINDSILGGLILYRGCKDYLYVHKSVLVMKQLDRLYSNLDESQDSGIQRQFYNAVESEIERITIHKLGDKQLLEESLIHRVLGDTNRGLNRIVEKIKIAPYGVEEYLFLNSAILKQLISASNGSEVNDVRGLYTCLNIIQLSQLHYQYFLLPQQQQQSVEQSLKALLKLYSTEEAPKQGLYLSNNYLIEQSYFPSPFKIVEATTKTKQTSLLFSSNYSRYLRYSFFVNSTFLDYYRCILLYMGDFVSQYQLLKRELNAMETLNCYFGRQSDLLKIPSIQNKVFVRKKYDYLISHQTNVLPQQIVRDAFQVPKQKIATFTKFQKIDLGIHNNENTLVENVLLFQQFIGAIGALALEMNITSQEVRLNLKQKAEIARLHELSQLLPFIQDYIQLPSIESPIMKDTFSQYYQQLANLKNDPKKDTLRSKAVKIYYQKVHFASFRTFPHSQSLALRQLVRSSFTRKQREFNNEDHCIQAYYHYLHMQKYEEPFRLHRISSLKELFDFRKRFTQALKLRLWIEAKIISFGASLPPKELLSLRMVLSNSQNNFGIFWVDQSSELIKHAQIVKMRYENVEEYSVKDQYTFRFLTYENLKTQYKHFLDTLGDLDLKNEGLQILCLLHTANRQMFASLMKAPPEFLQSYCFLKNIQNRTSRFIVFSTGTNPNRYLRQCPPFKMSLFKRFLWSDGCSVRVKENLVFFDERCANMKQVLNSSNTKMTELTNQMVAQLYQGQRMKQLMNHLEIDLDRRSKEQYRAFLKKLQENLLLGVESLDKFEKYLSKFIEKILKDKPELINIKDQVLQRIYKSRFCSHLVLNKLYQMARETLQDELSLATIMHENYAQKEAMRQNKIIRATVNKVLVPKIIINPFLESPLILDNYFFAASLKLSYIDSFLNRLKNRAIMVELAQGGFGFLLKIGELDECVQSLCKGLITFTEKEFNDRFRTYLEAYDQLKQKYRKASVQNRHLKGIVEMSREEKGKQLRSIIYSKLDSYLITIHTKEKTYQSLFNTIKSLQTEIIDRVSHKYQQTIQELKLQNQQLKNQFASFRHIVNHNAKMSMEESRDTLYNTFKKDIEGILCKDIFKKTEHKESVSFQEHKETATQALLQRLRTQKVFYQMKLSAQESKLKAKTDEINRLQHQITSIQNTLSSEQFKIAKMTDEIKSMHIKNVRIQELKRQIDRRQEEQTINKFKLLKINENLQGKLARLEQKKTTDSKAKEESHVRVQRSIGVQTLENPRKERRNFKIRTESGQPSQGTRWFGERSGGEQLLWKEKWEQSQRKYQLLMSKVLQAFESYSMTKNSARLVQRVRLIVEQCSNNRFSTKTSSYN